MKLKWKRGKFQTKHRVTLTGDVEHQTQDGWVSGSFGLDRRECGNGLRWVVTHIPTGYSAGSVSYRLKSEAQGLVEALVRHTNGHEAWSTSDPEAVKGIPGLQEAANEYRAGLLRAP